MQNEDKILIILEKMQTDISGIKTDVAVLKTDVAVLKTDVAELNTRVGNLETRMDRLEEKQESTHGVLILLENSLVPRVNALHEQYDGFRKELVPRIEKLEDKVDKLVFGKEVIDIATILKEKIG